MSSPAISVPLLGKPDIGEIPSHALYGNTIFDLSSIPMGHRREIFHYITSMIRTGNGFPNETTFKTILNSGVSGQRKAELISIVAKLRGITFDSDQY